MQHSGHELGHKKIVITYEEIFSFHLKYDLKVLREVLESLGDGKKLNWTRS